MKSWKTTLIGIGAAVLTFAGNYLATGKLPSLTEILLALGIGGVGAVARDNNKSSEAVGAK
jgi:hypothetical protein